MFGKKADFFELCSEKGKSFGTNVRKNLRSFGITVL
jgi:hypothetical protein